MPVAAIPNSLAYAELVEDRRPPLRLSRQRAEKTCRYCQRGYMPRPRERDERAFCHDPTCERAHEAAQLRERRTPRPLLIGNS